jgi:hypothetical protein
MHKITRRRLDVTACIILSLLLLGFKSEARIDPPSVPLADAFARSGPLMNPKTNQPVEVNGKPLPANVANLSMQDKSVFSKGQCALYVKNDIMRFNTILKNQGVSDQELMKAHLNLGSSIYPPELHDGNAWAETGSITLAECRTVALNVTRVLRQYLKSSPRFEESGDKENEQTKEKAEEKLSELQRIKMTICRAFNPVIQENGEDDEEEDDEDEEDEEDEEDSKLAGNQRNTPQQISQPKPVITRANLPPRKSISTPSVPESVKPSPQISPRAVLVRQNSSSLAKPTSVTTQPPSSRLRPTFDRAALEKKNRQVSDKADEEEDVGGVDD